MNKKNTCEYCSNPLTTREQKRFCSTKCAGLARRKGKITYTFSSDGKIGYGKLLTGEVFIFDSEDYDKIRNTMWYRSVQGAHGEAYVADCNSHKLHRVIMNAPADLYVDHNNLDTLDNRKCNLRICNHRDNLCNRALQPNNKSGVSGVSWKKRRGTWNARVKYYGQEIHLGAYRSFVEAVQARNEGMKWLYGDFGRYNDVPEAPRHIKEYVEAKCRCFIFEAAADILEATANV